MNFQKERRNVILIIYYILVFLHTCILAHTPKNRQFINQYIKSVVLQYEKNRQLQQALLFQGISKLDIFGQSITLRMNRQSSYKTVFGGCSSLLLLIILILIFSSNIRSFFNKESLSATVLTEFEEIPSLSLIDDSFFLFAVQIDQDNFLSNPFYDIKIHQYHVQKFLNGSVIQIEKEIKLIPCTLDRFNKIFSQFGRDMTDQFNQFKLYDFLCFDYNQTISIQGTYSNLEFDYLKIQVHQCSNKTNCASNEELQQEIDKNGAFKIKLFPINKVHNRIIQILNPYKPEDNYLQTFLDDSFFFRFLPSNIYKSVDLFIKEYEVTNDQSLFPFSYLEHSQFYTLDQSEIKERTEIQNNSVQSYVQIQIRKSPYKIKIFRKYLKIDELLSNLGGIQQIFIFFIGTILTIYNRFQLLVELANKLYEFTLVSFQKEKYYQDNLELVNQMIHYKQDKVPQQDKPRNSDIDLEIQPMHQSTINQKSKNELLKFSEQISPQSQKRNPLKQQTENMMKKNKFIYEQEAMAFKLNCSNGLEYFQLQIQNLIQRSQPILMTFQMLINFLTCQKVFRHKKHIQLMNKAIDQITEQIDLFNILTKLNDLEKLKEVIFSQQQLLMFNFAPKPLISLDNTKEVFNRTVVEERTRSNNTKQQGLSLISGMIPPKSWNPQIKYTTISKQMRRCMQRFILYSLLIYSKAYDDVLQEAENDQDQSICISWVLKYKLSLNYRNLQTFIKIRTTPEGEG
ncbi:unnamed protein product (macronuclear) [Paramecium tetraurelia]|uniref:Transmembrane protein n=1 Tax=Paramecium tetraurelia TaxID=5888 RepID=A0D365_PARTE|nr:uncharacterized protein GSPATT00012967001 [Paramecium tetraurelia]CAK77482.1 unnamed protein product [Paramecium tetraurelia]|eukprot:XP_001444879.1 hypothetical protein (macronuclear) [Paramecium tetraurelia strain d4-2]